MRFLCRTTTSLWKAFHFINRDHCYRVTLYTRSMHTVCYGHLAWPCIRVETAGLCSIMWLSPALNYICNLVILIFSHRISCKNSYDLLPNGKLNGDRVRKIPTIRFIEISVSLRYVTAVKSVRLSVMLVNDGYDSTETRIEVAYDLSNAAVIDDLDCPRRAVA